MVTPAPPRALRGAVAARRRLRHRRVLGWNDAPVERGRGSAIFLHVARPGYAPTDGCVALDAADLRVLLADGLTALRVLLA